MVRPLNQPLNLLLQPRGQALRHRRWACPRTLGGSRQGHLNRLVPVLLALPLGLAVPAGLAGPAGLAVAGGLAVALPPAGLGAQSLANLPPLPPLPPLPHLPASHQHHEAAGFVRPTRD